jgi:hypothetical protein
MSHLTEYDFLIESSWVLSCEAIRESSNIKELASFFVPAARVCKYLKSSLWDGGGGQPGCGTSLSLSLCGINLLRSKSISRFALDSSIKPASSASNGLLIECAPQESEKNLMKNECWRRPRSTLGQRCEHEFRIIGLACVIEFLLGALNWNASRRKPHPRAWLPIRATFGAFLRFSHKLRPDYIFIAA